MTTPRSEINKRESRCETAAENRFVFSHLSATLGLLSQHYSLVFLDKIVKKIGQRYESASSKLRELPKCLQKSSACVAFCASRPKTNARTSSFLISKIDTFSVFLSEINISLIAFCIKILKLVFQAKWAKSVHCWDQKCRPSGKFSMNFLKEISQFCYFQHGHVGLGRHLPRTSRRVLLHSGRHFVPGSSLFRRRKGSNTVSETPSALSKFADFAKKRRKLM